MKITFAHRLFLYSAVLGYIILDMNVIHGPLRRAIDERRIDSAKSIQKAHDKGLVALVLGRPITTAQVEYECRERAWSQGKSWDQMPEEARKFFRANALNDLIDHQIIRSKIKANASNIAIDAAVVEQHWQVFSARFPSTDEMLATLTSHGISSEEEMRLRIEATLQQEQYIRRQFEAWVKITDEQIVAFYQKHHTALAIPERVHVRHVFWASLAKDPAVVKHLADQTLAELTANERSFYEIAAAQSEDENSKHRGGDVGWLTAERTPDDFFASVITLPVQQAAVVQTKLGWHLVEVLEKRPPLPRTLDECREEIRHTLEDLQRKPYLENLRHAMRRDHQKHIHIYNTVIDEMP